MVSNMREIEYCKEHLQESIKIVGIFTAISGFIMGTASVTGTFIFGIAAVVLLMFVAMKLLSNVDEKYSIKESSE